MGKITFILGGARSGKSTLAVQLAKNKKGRVAFIPTCKPLDSEMKKRIILHKMSRPAEWATFETDNIAACIKNLDPKFKTIIIDCLTLLVSGYVLQKLRQERIQKNIENLLELLVKSKADSIIVSNEVGLGIVPMNKITRDFRDIAGKINQLVAKKADKVLFLVSGIPLRIK